MSPRVGPPPPVLFPPPVGDVRVPKERTSLAMRPAPQPDPVDVFDPTPAITFGAAGGVRPTDGRLSPSARHEQLPSDLASKVSEQVWMDLPKGQRSTLIASYQQFKRSGVWDQVTRVLGEKEQREAPTKLPGGREADVAGNSGAIQYELADPKAFVNGLVVANPEFGVDGGVMGAMHAGQISIRQAGQSTSLHVSVGPGKLMDAHIDRVTPVDTPVSGRTQMNPGRGVRHWSREVLPEMIRKGGGPAGIIVTPTLDGGRRTEPGAAGPQWTPNGAVGGEGRVMVNLELSGIRARKPELTRAAREGSPSVPSGVMEKVDARLKQVKIAFPVPKGVDPREAPRPEDLAPALARKIQEAVEKGESNIRVDLGNTYAGLPGMQTRLLGEVAKLTRVVRSELEKAGVDVSGVSSLTVTMGHVAGKAATEGGTVAL